MRSFVIGILFAFGTILPAQAAQFSVTPIATNLQSPRGLAFGPDGHLYIAEAGSGGTGPCLASPSVQGSSICYGATGAIARLNVRSGALDRPIVGLPSLALPGSGGDASGINDVSFDASGNLFGVIGLAGNPSLRETVLGIPEFGQIISTDLGSSTWQVIADLAAFERDNNPDGTDLISNPYSLIAGNGQLYAIDAGGNSLFQLKGNDLQLETTFPLRSVANPLPPPAIIPLQSVPTGMAIAPDGSLIIAEYTGFPFPTGGANLYRYNGINLEVLATGFTNIVDIGFSETGDLYVLEFARNILLNDFRGRLWKIDSQGRKTIVVDEGLLFPTGLAIRNKEVFIANQGFFAGVGEILVVRSVPEPKTSGLVWLGFGLVAYGYRVIRKYF